MTKLYHKAIRIAYPQTVTIRGTVAYDNNDNIINTDQLTVSTKLAELTAAEPMRQLRIQRDQLLSATDWWCVSDRTATPEQLAYRQALRDLPSTATPALDEDGNLTGVNWPTKPE